VHAGHGQLNAMLVNVVNDATHGFRSVSLQLMLRTVTSRDVIIVIGNSSKRNIVDGIAYLNLYTSVECTVDYMS